MAAWTVKKYLQSMTLQRETNYWLLCQAHVIMEKFSGFVGLYGSHINQYFIRAGANRATGACHSES